MVLFYLLYPFCYHLKYSIATIDDFHTLDIRVGEIVKIDDLPEARKPAYKLEINNDEANQIYREHGAQRLERMVRKLEDTAEIVESGYYESREEFERIVTCVDKDERIGKLFTDFKKLIIGVVTDEEYETV